MVFILPLPHIKRKKANLHNYSSANNKSQSFAVVGVKCLLSMLDMFPDKGIVQLLVAKTFAALSADGTYNYIFFLNMFIYLQMIRK